MRSGACWGRGSAYWSDFCRPPQACQKASCALRKQSWLTLHTLPARLFFKCVCVSDLFVECECVRQVQVHILCFFFCINVHTIKRMCVWQARLTKEHRWGSTLLSRHQSLEEEFERAKAAVEVSRVQLCIKSPRICNLSKTAITAADF